VGGASLGGQLAKEADTAICGVQLKNVLFRGISTVQERAKTQFLAEGSLQTISMDSWEMGDQ